MSSGAGRRGEDFAREVLERAGYRILAANYHSRYGEIDLIAQTEGEICFVEVKTRRPGAMVSGRDAVTAAKQSRIIKTALLYLQETGCQLQPRFDVFTAEVNQAGEILRYDYLTGAFDGHTYQW